MKALKVGIRSFWLKHWKKEKPEKTATAFLSFQLSLAEQENIYFTKIETFATILV